MFCGEHEFIPQGEIHTSDGSLVFTCISSRPDQQLQYQARNGGLTDATTARTILTISRNSTRAAFGKAWTPRGKIHVQLPALETPRLYCCTSHTAFDIPQRLLVVVPTCHDNLSPSTRLSLCCSYHLSSQASAVTHLTFSRTVDNFLELTMLLDYFSIGPFNKKLSTMTQSERALKL